MRVGVEVGGTFTDLVLIDGDDVRIAKVPSTPSAPDIGALAAIAKADIEFSRIAELIHGSTVATNAVLERKGAKICLFVTKGLRDLLLLQRHDKQQIYDLHYAKPKPVVPRRDTFEIDERIGPDGGVVTAIDAEALRGIVAGALTRADYQAAAICLVNGYLNPEHEAAVAEAIRAVAPDLPITLSHEVTREFREYERASTTTLSAYVQPVLKGYLDRMSERLNAGGFVGEFSIMQSNGGRLPAEAVGRNAITALFSGPAAGVMGAVRQVERSGFDKLITLDMGGTSTDVSLVAGGRPDMVGATEIDGLPVKTPVLDIVTVGAGGGSLVWVDDGGLLRVGPRSAGADPGPACYGRGGTEPTVTDAHLVRGTLRLESFLGGAMTVQREAALASFEALAKQFDSTIEAMADSAIQIAEANIVRAVQRVSTERGRDPRDFAVVAFGGAGPLHAVRVAEDLGIATVIVPPNAGVLSATGLLVSDHVHYAARTNRLTVDDDSMPEIRALLSQLAEEVEAHLRGVGLEGEIRHDCTIDMRYRGQAFEISVPIPAGRLDDLGRDELIELFEVEHKRVFEFSKPSKNTVQAVSYRIGGSLPPATLPAMKVATGAAEPGEPISIQEHGAERDALRLRRDRLGDGAHPGPCLIQDDTCSTYVPPGWSARMDHAGNLIVGKTDGDKTGEAS